MVREVSRVHFRQRSPDRRGNQERLYVEYEGLGQASRRGHVVVVFVSDSLDFGLAQDHPATPNSLYYDLPTMQKEIEDLRKNPEWVEILS